MKESTSSEAGVQGFTELRYEHLRRLTEISRALTYTLDIDAVVRLAAERAAALLEAESSLLMLADGDGMLRVRAAHGIDTDVLDRFREPLHETLIRQLQGLLGVTSPESFLGVPLVVHGLVTGLLAVVRPEEKPVSEEEEWLLSAVADQVAVAVENARLVEEVRRERERHTATAHDAGTAGAISDRALATISHDLRSPLSAIDSYAELMEMEIYGPVTDRQREALGRIRVSGRHLLAVLENVLQMTRLTAHAVRMRSDVVPARRVIEEAVLIVQPSATERTQQISVRADGAPELAADPDRLRQVLVNLLGNASKYSPYGASIRIEAGTRTHEGRLVGYIAVIDTGPGIPADERQLIFQPYYRLPDAKAGNADGLGLGLAISRELIHQMGGQITVESESGAGSTFTVLLPIASA